VDGNGGSHQQQIEKLATSSLAGRLQIRRWPHDGTSARARQPLTIVHHHVRQDSEIDMIDRLQRTRAFIF